MLTSNILVPAGVLGANREGHMWLQLHYAEKRENEDFSTFWPF